MTALSASGAGSARLSRRPMLADADRSPKGRLIDADRSRKGRLADADVSHLVLIKGRTRTLDRLRDEAWLRDWAVTGA